MHTPEEVLAFKKPTEGFSCSLSDNKYKIEFLEFEIKDYDTSKSVFKVSRDDAPDLSALSLEASKGGVSLEDLARTVRYNLPKEFLKFKTVRTMLKFCVGPLEVPSFRMIERHYYKGELLRNYDFTFGFCIPNSTNTWEAVYDMPVNSKERINDMVGSPDEHVSDSFYFVEDKLVMHNKAYFKYV